MKRITTIAGVAGALALGVTQNAQATTINPHAQLTGGGTTSTQSQGGTGSTTQSTSNHSPSGSLLSSSMSSQTPTTDTSGSFTPATTMQAPTHHGPRNPGSPTPVPFPGPGSGSPTPSSVPDQAATASLLGMGLVATGMVKRKLKKS